MADIMIRPARAEDLDAIWPMVSRAVVHMNQLGNPQWGEDYPTRAHYAADQARDELYVAEDEDGTILGAVCLNQDQAPEYALLPWAISGPAMVLHRLAVDPAAQRRGVGRSFFQFAEAMARCHGLPTFHLDTYARNDRMQALIRSQGFTQVGMVHFDREGRPDGFPCFEKVL